MMQKILFVDDEIMAMKFLYDMLEWEELGFEVAAMETNPRKALELMKNKKIDIAFVDIRMPGLDGLEFTEKALAINPRLKVLILTSYGDFDYARKAVHLGVTSYLLKHDLKSESLAEELERLKLQIDQEEKNGKIVAADILKRTMEFGVPLSDEEIIRLRQYIDMDEKHMVCFWVELDVPIVKENYTRLYNYPVTDEFMINECVEMLDDKRNLTINLEQEKWMVLNIFETTVSQKKIQEEVFTAAYQIQRYVYKNYEGRTVSVVPSKVFNDINEISKIYNQLRDYAKYLIFYERNRVLDIRGLPQRKNIGSERLQGTVKRIYEYLQDDDLGQVILETDRFFGTCTVSMDFESLYYFWREIHHMTADYIRKYQLSDFRECREITQQVVYSAKELHNYIATQFELIIREKQDKDFAHVPERIRKAVKYLHNSYDQDIRLEDVAEHMAVSGEYLRHLFKADMKESFTEYLTKLRIEKAKKLLLEKRYRLYEVAEMVGYKSGNYFSNIFKKTTGIKPQEYSGEQNEE